MTVTRQQGFSRLAAEYVAMQAGPRTPGAFSELYIRGFEAAVEVAVDRREEGRNMSWVRLAYDRAVADLEWLGEDHEFVMGRQSKLATLLVFEWGVTGQGVWHPQDFGDDDMHMPEFLEMGRLGDIIGHDDPDPTGDRTITTYWRLWPSGWEKWVVV